MPRYAPGTVLDYTPFDRDVVLARVLGGWCLSRGSGETAAGWPTGLTAR